MDDQKVFDVFAKGDTTGIFQFESAGMRRYLQELVPNNFEDIIVMVSLYRPGPMLYIPTYIKRKHGKEKVKYPHESLAKILELTQGIAVYQEQIMQIVQAFAGFSLGEADILRRAMGKKIKELMDEQKGKFIEAATKLGHSEKLATYIFTDIIEPFAGYGFNKSHAACYSMIAYQTAYLKAYYPTEFLTALMVSDEDDTDRIVLEINEAKANLLYTEIDRNPLFKGSAAVADRSNMNATFLLNDESHAPIFDKMWKEAGISGLPGHRSVGGYRASMYNALPIESVQALVDVMQALEKAV